MLDYIASTSCMIFVINQVCPCHTFSASEENISAVGSFREWTRQRELKKQLANRSVEFLQPDIHMLPF